MIYTSLLLFTLFVSTFFPTHLMPQTARECTIRINGFDSDKGKAFIKVLDSSNKTLKTSILAISDKQVLYKIDVTGHTKVAVQVFHDVNNNKKLDKNIFGAPSEPWGISGETRPSLRAPTLAEMLVSIQKDIQITVK